MQTTSISWASSFTSTTQCEESSNDELLCAQAVPVQRSSMHSSAAMMFRWRSTTALCVPNTVSL